jgi:hypothetical protein
VTVDGQPIDGQRTSFWERVLYCDPRILYIVFAVIVAIFEFAALPLPVHVTDGVEQLYDTIEALPHDKIVLIDNDWGAGTRGECYGMVESIVRHLFRRGIRFAMVSWAPNVEGQQFAKDIPALVAREMGKSYGVDYCCWGAIQPAGGAELAALARGIRSTVAEDLSRPPIPFDDLPMMRDVRDIHDISLIVRIAYTWDAIPWIGFVQGVYGTPLGIGCAAITASTAYPFLDSGQICGLLSGASGAAQYEQLVGMRTGVGQRTAQVQSFVTLYVVVAVIIGNIAYFKTPAARRDRRRLR